MNRKTFFKKLFLGAAAVVVAPKILAPEKKFTIRYIDPAKIITPYKRTGGVIPFIVGADPYKMDSKVHITDIRKCYPPVKIRELYKYHQGESFFDLCKNGKR